MKRTKTKRNPTAKELTERLETLTHRLRLQADHWRGYAAHLELAGADDLDGSVCSLRNCAADLEGHLARAGRAA